MGIGLWIGIRTGPKCQHLSPALSLMFTIKPDVWQSCITHSQTGSPATCTLVQNVTSSCRLSPVNSCKNVNVTGIRTTTHASVCLSSVEQVGPRPSTTGFSRACSYTVESK